MTTARPTGPIVALSAAGVGLVLEACDERLPAIVHWGAALDGLDDRTARALVEASVPLSGINDVEPAARVAVLPEAGTGWNGRPGLSGSRDGRGWSPRWRVSALHVDGVLVRGVHVGGAAAVRVDAVDDDGGLALVLDLALLPTGLLRARATVTNTAADPYTLDALQLTFPVPPGADELLDLAGRWGHERAPQRRAFTVGAHVRENRRGRTGADSAYVLHAGVPGFGFASGEVHAVHTAWSGNHVHYAERVFTGRRVLGGGELLLPGEVRLQHGDSYTSPWLYGAHGDGLDAVALRFHEHQRARVRRVDAQRPITLNVWEAVYFDHDAPRLLDLASRAAALGVERFVLDDGWFGARRDDHAGLGDWVVSGQVWPDGLHPLVDRVHELGMQFGLWFEPEMVNPDSDLARAHPEWIMAARADLPVESRNQQVLNLSIPDAYAHVRDQMLAILREYRIDYIKWDHNRDLVEAGDRTRGGRAAVHEQTLAYYRLLDELRGAHPALEIESCSSGGARIDLEVLARTDRVWVSDCIDPHERQQMHRWTTQLIPPEYMGAHIASGRSHTTGRAHDLGFRAATAVFGHLGIEWDLTLASPAELAELADWLAFYKAHRELLLGGRLVRIDAHDDALVVHGVVAPDGARALFCAALVAAPDASPTPRLRLRGLDAQRAYHLRPVLVGAEPSGLHPPRWWGAPVKEPGARVPAYPGTVLTGAALEHAGVAAPLLHLDQAVLYRADAV